MLIEVTAANLESPAGAGRCAGLQVAGVWVTFGLASCTSRSWRRPNGGASRAAAGLPSRSSSPPPSIKLRRRERRPRRWVGSRIASRRPWTRSPQSSAAGCDRDLEGTAQTRRRRPGSVSIRPAPGERAHTNQRVAACCSDPTWTGQPDAKAVRQLIAELHDPVLRHGDRTKDGYGLCCIGHWACPELTELVRPLMPGANSETGGEFGDRDADSVV